MKKLLTCSNKCRFQAYQHIDKLIDNHEYIMDQIWTKYFEAEDEFKQYVADKMTEISRLYTAFSLFLDSIELYHDGERNDIVYYKGNIMLDIAKKSYLEDEMRELIYANRLLPMKDNIYYIISPEYIKYFYISMNVEVDNNLIRIIHDVGTSDKFII